MFRIRETYLLVLRRQVAVTSIEYNPLRYLESLNLYQQDTVATIFHTISKREGCRQSNHTHCCGQYNKLSYNTYIYILHHIAHCGCFYHLSINSNTTGEVDCTGTVVYVVLLYQVMKVDP